MFNKISLFTMALLLTASSPVFDAGAVSFLAENPVTAQTETFIGIKDKGPAINSSEKENRPLTRVSAGNRNMNYGFHFLFLPVLVLISFFTLLKKEKLFFEMPLKFQRLNC